jgi:uncharacterized protein (DUF2126 family)
MWRDRSLIASEGQAASFGPLEAQLFMATLARRLQLDPEYVNPAFDDPLHYLQKERQLPVNVDPLLNQLADEQDRERVRRVFERGLHVPVGYVLPVQRAEAKNGPQWRGERHWSPANRLLRN